MDLSYIVNKDLISTSKKLLRAATDIAQEIPVGGEFVTPRVVSTGYSFFRLQLNFNEAIDIESIDVEFKDVNSGSPTISSAGGMEVSLPMLVTRSMIGYENRVLYTDGDIPLYNDDFFIRIRNNGTKPINLRNVNVRLIG